LNDEIICSRFFCKSNKVSLLYKFFLISNKAAFAGDWAKKRHAPSPAGTKVAVAVVAH
jgi:hypothetical protein